MAHQHSSFGLAHLFLLFFMGHLNGPIFAKGFTPGFARLPSA
jgi:hypothetical protein